MLVFGTLSIVAGLSAILLPETKGKPLPQSLQQGAELAMDAGAYCW